MAFFGVLPSPDIKSAFFEINEHVNLIEFYKYLFLCIVLAFCYIALVSSMVHFISMLSKKDVTSAIISIIVLFILYMLGIKNTLGEKYNLNPINFNNASRIIEGSYNVNYTVAIIILIFTTLLVLFIGKRIFDSMDIS